MRKISKRKVAATIAITAILIGGGGAAAIAYWDAGGTGSGTALTGTVAGIQAVQTSTIGGIAPGSAPQVLSGNFTNSNSGPVWVTSVTAAVSSVAKSGTAPSGTCDSTDYTVSPAPMLVGAEIASGTAKGAWTGATIVFNDKATTNQDACKGATVTITYTVN
ncbi:MAG TPA: hypothetical protein VHZ98_05535 [Galbitalea sp.]|nr:hypothetical protein [Galbitalea sp.]